MRDAPGVGRVECAGSFRRRAATVGDLDLLASAAGGAAVGEHLAAFEGVREVLAQGPTRSSVRLRSGLQVDLRVVPEESFGSALHYLTGSKAHNIAVRRLAVERGLKLNEYGIFRGKRRLGGATEEEVFAAVELPWIEPELREDRGELEAARAGTLPRLVRLEDLRGDLHAHTEASDGTSDIAAMAAAAERLGHEYLAITDHTRSARVAGGLDPERTRAQVDEIERWNRRGGRPRLLASAEVDVLRDGSLDLPDELLGRLDLVVAGIHSSFQLPREAQTRRVLAALAHPRVHVLAHPTGRLLGERPGYELDLGRVLRAAAEHGVALEVNAQPLRLDLDDVGCRAAAGAGARLAIATDAHAPHQLEYLELGVAQARRGWIEAGRVLNALPWNELARALGKPGPASRRAPRALRPT
jgi:DNA polymerase (family 10)